MLRDVPGPSFLRPHLGREMADCVYVLLPLRPRAALDGIPLSARPGGHFTAALAHTPQLPNHRQGVHRDPFRSDVLPGGSRERD